MNRISVCRNLRFACIASLCITFSLTPNAFAQSPPDPDAMAATSVPDHDPEAIQGGKSALEHADDLDDARSLQRRMALQALGEMGIDALPARELVRFVAQHGGTADMTDAATDELRLGALAVLINMQAPEAEDMLRQQLLDPESLTRADSYRHLLDGARQIGVDDAVLRHDLLALVDSSPEHASQLMVLDTLEASVQGPLQEAIFNSDHDQSAIQHFLANLPEMEFLSNADKVAYITQHRALAEGQSNLTRDVLVAIGTDGALDLALEFDAERGFAPHQTISRFAAGPMSAQQVAGHLLAEAQVQTSEQDISHVLSSFEGMVRDLAADASSPESRVAYRRLYTYANSDLINEGPTDAHSIVGIQRQVLYLQRNETLELAQALDPIFDLLENGGVSPAVHNAAARSLRQTPARIAERDPQYFIDRSLALLWESSTAELAELPLHLLTALMRTPDNVDLVIDKVADQIDPYLESWEMNPAAAVAIYSGTLRGLDHSPVRETAAGVMGKAIASPALDMEYLLPHFARGGPALALLDHNTVEGVIAVFTPAIFASEKPDSYLFNMESFMQPMLGRPAWLQRDPDAMARWMEFLDRVVALDDPDFSPVAQQALDAL